MINKYINKAGNTHYRFNKFEYEIAYTIVVQ